MEIRSVCFCRKLVEVEIDLFTYIRNDIHEMSSRPNRRLRAAGTRILIFCDKVLVNPSIEPVEKDYQVAPSVDIR